MQYFHIREQLSFAGWEHAHQMMGLESCPGGCKLAVIGVEKMQRRDRISIAAQVPF
jgi:hypothetical protein